jgi:hypothetical protein
MPYFYSENRTVYSPENHLLNELYDFLECHNHLFSGSRLYGQLIEIYENLDEELKEEK